MKPVMVTTVDPPRPLGDRSPYYLFLFLFFGYSHLGKNLKTVNSTSDEDIYHPQKMK